MKNLTPKLAALTAAAALTVAGLSMVHADEKAAEAPADATANATEEKANVPAEWTYLGLDGLPADMKTKIEEELAPMLGKPMPELSLADGYNDGELTNEDLEGKIVIVDIWATWCGPCIAAIPKNNSVFEKYADQGVVILGVTTSRNGQEKLGEMVEKHDIKYPVAADPDLKTLEAFKAFFFPTYYAVDRDGIVRGVAVSPDKIEDVVKMLLEEDESAA